MITSFRVINSAFVKAPERFVLKGGSWRKIDIPVNYVVFEHEKYGKCLIDTGYNHRVTRGSRSFFLSTYASILRPRLQPETLPHTAPVIDHILLTHLHADHVSALNDYPEANIIAHKGGVEHFMSASSASRVRHGVFTELLPTDFVQSVQPIESSTRVEVPFGLGEGYDIFGDQSVIGVDLPGHMRGHVGYVFPQFPKPLLYAGDAQWRFDAIRQSRIPGFPASLIVDDAKTNRETVGRIERFIENGGEVVLCHDLQQGETS